MSDEKKPKNRRKLIIIGLVIALFFAYKSGNLNGVLENLNLPSLKVQNQTDEKSVCPHDCEECKDIDCNNCESCVEGCGCK